MVTVSTQVEDSDYGGGGLQKNSSFAEPSNSARFNSLMVPPARHRSTMNNNTDASKH
jgi:hypothetical protein